MIDINDIGLFALAFVGLVIGWRASRTPGKGVPEDTIDT